MAEIQRIHINQQTKKDIFKKHGEDTSKELLSILGGDENKAEGIVVPTQQQETDRVRFDTGVMHTASQQLQQKGYTISEKTFFHDHNEDENHGFGFSQQDLETGEYLFETQGIDRMGLVMNGRTDNPDQKVQHMIIANHQGELHDLEGEGGMGKVITMITDQNGSTKEIYSESIEEAKEKEKQLADLKEKLFDDEDVVRIAA